MLEIKLLPNPLIHQPLIWPHLTKAFSRGVALIYFHNKCTSNEEIFLSLQVGTKSGNLNVWGSEGRYKAVGAWVSEMFKHSCFPLRKNNFPILENKGGPPSVAQQNIGSKMLPSRSNCTKNTLHRIEIEAETYCRHFRLLQLCFNMLLMLDKYYSWVNLVVPKNWAASSAQNENLRPLLNRNIPLISGKNGLRNHFWPLESGFSHEQKWEKVRKRGLKQWNPSYAIL